MNDFPKMPKRIIKINDSELFRMAYSDYVYSQYFIENPIETQAFRITNQIFENAKEFWINLSPKQKMVCELGIFVPASIIGFSHGLVLPDIDITTIGIGWHRYFLFHSAIGAYILKKFFESYNDFIQDKYGETTKKIIGLVLASGAIGIGIHLLKDGSFGLLDGEKSVVFGIPGIGSINTLIKGTMVDDNIYLLGNSLWAFKIAKDIIVMTFGKDLDTAKKFFQKNYPKKTWPLLQ